jgi:hypothetical protein
MPIWHHSEHLALRLPCSGCEWEGGEIHLGWKVGCGRRFIQKQQQRSTIEEAQTTKRVKQVDLNSF